MTERYDLSRGPWRFSKGASKKLAGKSPASLYFSDPRQFFKLHEWMRSKGMTAADNNMVDYTYWVKDRGELLVPAMTCKYCRPFVEQIPFQLSLIGDDCIHDLDVAVEPEAVKFLSVVVTASGISVGSEYSCCQKDDCKEQVESLASFKRIQFLRATFESVARSQFHGIDYQQIVKALHEVYELPKRITAPKAHEILMRGTV